MKELDVQVVVEECQDIPFWGIGGCTNDGKKK